MDPERWREIQRLYHGAIEREPSTRAAFLAQACHADTELQSEVESLLGQSASRPTASRPAALEFPPGAIIGQRYRIVSLLGRGGMGEVYRADDLLLAQPIALKFLPRVASSDALLLNRFRDEVRIARQVTHPNVCRVYDIGEAEGLTYLTMEYVDGEDLESLLRRIGKLPSDKVLEITRQLCAGLAAAHEKGVIHRDLKPANIMLDGKGRVRITDFGLAGVAEEIRDPGSGTPAYMAPEQRAGKQVTSRSDIYALGVVLYELFTGRRPSGRECNPELDPEIERVLLRCVEPAPDMRPATAMSVAAALPGRNPLAAAVAAGETPLPEVVANAGPREGLRPAVAASCLGLVVLGLIGLFFVRQRADIVNQIPMENAPEVLAAKARDIAKSLGYVERPFDRAFGWEYNWNYFRYARQQKNTSALAPLLKAGMPTAVQFWYREAADYLVPTGGSRITPTDPVLDSPGMLEIVLDSQGNLIQFDARPAANIGNSRPRDSEQWSRLLALAGLDPVSLLATQPRLMPPVPFDAQAAWISNAPQGGWRVEAAAYQNRPIFLRRVMSSLAAALAGPTETRDSMRVRYDMSGLGFPIFFVALPVFASLLAWRNVRLGRGDHKGAFRLACLAFVGVLVADVLAVHHVPGFGEASLLYRALREASFLAVLFWVLYMAFEPSVRRRLPTVLISWNRLVGGRLRDPLVGSDVLAGIVFGIACSLLLAGVTLIAPLLSWPPLLPSGTGSVISLWSFVLISGVADALIFTFLLIVLTWVFRRTWLAGVIFFLIVTVSYSPLSGRGLLIAASIRGLLAVLSFFCLMRFGVLCTVAAFCVLLVLMAFPLTTNVSAWYFETGLTPALGVIALATYGFRTTVTGRRAWR